MAYMTHFTKLAKDTDGMTPPEMSVQVTFALQW
jgi:hypothetical protein